MRYKRICNPNYRTQPSVSSTLHTKILPYKERTRCTSIHISLQQMRDRVVRHVYCRVRERFYQILLIPRQLRTEAVAPRTRVLMEPVYTLCKVVTSFPGVTMNKGTLEFVYVTSILPTVPIFETYVSSKV